MENQTAQNHVAAGEILAGKYRVERPLGMGGMGVVVAATHLDLREERAIKLMRADLNHPQIVERFLREARAVVKLRSEHVAQVYDIGRLPTGAPFIVMELLHGQDLAALLKKRGTLSVHEAVLYVMQVCDALAEAHGRGIVHRDLKPANLFLTHREDGSPCIKVLDFGVSKHIPEDGEATEMEMTHNGDIMGSPLYMAPEQMRAAREVDARADLWALGAILYKLLTGRAPFQRPTTPEICMAVLGSEAAPPLSTLRRGVPSGLDAVIMRCLSKDLDSRFPRALDVKAALTPYAERREGWSEDDALSPMDEPRSGGTSNSSRPIPRNIDAILLGCIGKEGAPRAARAPGRRAQSDPFLRRAESPGSEPKRPSAVLELLPQAAPAAAEPSSEGGGTVPMGNDEVLAARNLMFGRAAQSSPSPASDRARESPAMAGTVTDAEETLHEATALLPPRLPSFSSFPPPAFGDRAPMPSSSNLLPPAAGEFPGNSVAPWGYAPSIPAPRRAKPVALIASATTAAFIVVALVVAFTTGGNEKADAAAAPRMRPASGGLVAAPEPVEESPTEAAAPTTSASAAGAPGTVVEAPGR